MSFFTLENWLAQSSS